MNGTRLQGWIAAAWCVCASTGVAREHTVRCGGHRALLEAEGSVTCEVSDYLGVFCPGHGVLVTWRALDGAVLRKGDPIYTYSTERRRAVLPEKELDLLRA